MKEICAKCKKPKSKHYGRRMTIHPYGWELACTVNGIDCFTPIEMVSVPKELIEAVRELMEKHDAMTSKPNVVTIGDYEQVRFTVLTIIDQIDGKDGGE